MFLHIPLHAYIHHHTHEQCYFDCICVALIPGSGTNGLGVFYVGATVRLYAPSNYLGNQQLSYGLNFTIRILLLNGAVPATQFPVYLTGGPQGLTLVGSAAVADSQTFSGPIGNETLLTLTVSSVHYCGMHLSLC